jgi:hypothetical protein
MLVLFFYYFSGLAFERFKSMMTLKYKKLLLASHFRTIQFLELSKINKKLIKIYKQTNPKPIM